jgi:DNA-binding CsgD family transcriptional regulator
MSDLGPHLQKAWSILLPTLLKNPDDMRQRIERAKSAIARPPRPWCLTLRASDTRIPRQSFYRLHIDLPNITQVPILNHEIHGVEISSKLLISLNQPVHILPPGQPPPEVAKLLGRSVGSLTTARINSQFRTHHLPRNHRGQRTAMLYTPHELDPSACLPLSALGRHWPSIWSFGRPILPANFSQHLIRVPIYLPRTARDPDITPYKPQRLPPPQPDYVPYKWKDGKYIESKYEKDLAIRREKRRDKKRNGQLPPRPRSSEGSLHFHGWNFLCPSCKKPVRLLLLWLPFINYYRMLPDLKLPEHLLRELDETQQTPLPTFACYDCHNILPAGFPRTHEWSNLVRYLSRGLLYPREVPIPEDFDVPPVKKHRIMLNVKAPRRQAVLRRILNGWTYEQIARDLEMNRTVVSTSVAILLRQENVKTRTELAKKLGSPHPQPLRRKEKVAARRAKFLPLYLKGLTYAELATALNTTFGSINRDIKYLFKKYGIPAPESERRTRQMLAEKLGYKPTRTPL